MEALAFAAIMFVLGFLAFCIAFFLGLAKRNKQMPKGDKLILLKKEVSTMISNSESRDKIVEFLRTNGITDAIIADSFIRDASDTKAE